MVNNVKYQALSDKAYELHQQNRLDEAEEIYKCLLGVNPQDVNVLNLLGMLYMAKKMYKDSIEYLSKAVVLNSTGYIVSNLAKAYYFIGEYDKAISLYLKSIAIEKNDDTYFSLGLAYKAKKDYDSAIDAYIKAIEINEKNYNAHYNLASLLNEMGDYSHAIDYAEKAETLDDVDLDLYTLESNIYEKLNCYEKAIIALKNAIALYPEYSKFYYNLGVLHSKLNQTTFSIDAFKIAIKLSPDDVEAYVNLANIYKDTDLDLALETVLKAYSLDSNSENVCLLLSQIYKDKFDNLKSLEVLNNLIEKHPDNADAYQLIAINNMDLGNYQIALDNYENALKLEPDNLNFLHGKSSALKYLGREDDAFELLKYVVSQDNSNIQSAITLGMAYLKNKDFEKGMNLYSKRSLDTKFTQIFNDKIWSKETTLVDKTVLVYSDCGLGDSIMFARYLPELLKIAKKVILQTDIELVSIFQFNFPKIEVISKIDTKPQFDVALPIMNISYALGIDFSTIPAAEGYLQVPKQAVDKINDLNIIKKNGKNIGIFYQGNKRVFKNRSVGFDNILKIVDSVDANFYSFQLKDDIENEKIISLNKFISNYSDTAALLKSIDLLITIDSSIAHMAGALGVNTYLLLPHTAEWRWFNDTKTTPWYNCVKIFKQNSSDSWNDVISSVIKELK